MKWYLLAAAQGFARAQFNLGQMYEESRSVPQDYLEAAKWFRLAAAQGYAEAQNNLGRLYAEGCGVTQDYVRACMWFNLAAAKGVSAAQRNRDEAAKRMTPPQIAEAQRMATDCEQRNYKNCDEDMVQSQGQLPQQRSN